MKELEIKANFKVPFYSFAQFHRNDINGTRKLLFGALRNISPYYEVEIKRFLKKKNGGEKYVFPFGELLPWIIKDLTKWEDQESKLGIGWLALYYYTLILDDFIDNNYTSPPYLLTGTALARIGFCNLAKIVKGTPFETYIEKAFDDALNFELQDAQNQLKNAPLKQKITYSEGKNKVALACAGAIAAYNSKHSDFIIAFVNSLLLAIQFIDDITDFEQDAKDKNITVLLHSFPRSTISFVNRYELLDHMISNGNLFRVVCNIYNNLQEGLNLIVDHKLFDKNNISIQLITDLIVVMHNFKTYLSKLEKEYKKYGQKEKKNAIIKVEKYIGYFAQTT